VFVFAPDENASDFENRAMETFPDFSARSFISGEFFERFESHLLDNTTMRTSWLTFAQIAENSYGITFSGGATAVVFNAADLGQGLIPFTQDISNDEAERVYVITNGVVNPYEPFSIDNMFNENAVLYLRFTENRGLAARYAEILNAYRAEVAEDVRMFSLISPVKVEFMGERYAAVNSSQLNTINFVNSLLDENIITVDAHSILEAHSDEYIFFRTDHHWTALGAYYAYLAFAEAAGFEPITIENYTEHAIEGFIGSLAVGTRNRTILSHPDTIYFYTLNDTTEFSIDMFIIPNISALCYRLFLGGDRDIYTFTTSNTNGRSLVTIKDSFANAMLPWLAPHYETITVIDPRQFSGSVLQVMENKQNVDLLFINYIPATTMPELIEQLSEAR